MQFMHTLFVYDEELSGGGGGLQGYSLCFLGNKLKGCNCSRLGVNVRTHLLCKNFSSNFSSIRSGPISFQLRQIVHVGTSVT